jgi:hypothetical protein
MDARRPALTAIAALACALVPGRAGAEQAEAGDGESPLTWYGKPAAIVGAVTTLGFLCATKVEEPGVAAACAIPAVFTFFVPPYIHSGRGNIGRALLSGGLQIGALVAFAQIRDRAENMCTRPGAPDDCDADPAYAVLPFAAATAIDAGLLSWDRVRIVPTVAIGRDHASIGIAAQF